MCFNAYRLRLLAQSAIFIKVRMRDDMMHDDINDVVKRSKLLASHFINRTYDSLNMFAESCYLENNIKGRIYNNS